MSRIKVARGGCVFSLYVPPEGAGGCRTVFFCALFYLLGPSWMVASEKPTGRVSGFNCPQFEHQAFKGP